MPFVCKNQDILEEDLPTVFSNEKNVQVGPLAALGNRIDKSVERSLGGKGALTKGERKPLTQQLNIILTKNIRSRRRRQSAKPWKHNANIKVKQRLRRTL